MLTVKVTGSVSDMIRQLRAVHGEIVPYAAATALTRTAKIAQKDTIPTEMRRVFSQPRSYTQNALFVVPATKDELVARIGVKNQAASNATRPENYLFPQVEGGPRKAKRSEVSMRNMGLLASGEILRPAHGLPMSDYESGAFIRRVLRDVDADRRPGARRGTGKRLIVAPIGRRDQLGVWEETVTMAPSDKRPGKQRQLRKYRPLLMFMPDSAIYLPRLDFQRVVTDTAHQHLKAEFSRALTALLARRR